MTLYPSELPADRADILRSKYMYGIWYGVVVGVTFSIFTWGVDAYELHQINGLYPWLKFFLGVFPCMLVGGLAGWLCARIGKPLLGLLLWATAASVFAWLTVNLPLRIIPLIVPLMEPDLRDLLHYTYYEQFAFRFGIAYAWLA